MYNDCNQPANFYPQNSENQWTLDPLWTLKAWIVGMSPAPQSCRWKTTRNLNNIDKHPRGQRVNQQKSLVSSYCNCSNDVRLWFMMFHEHPRQLTKVMSHLRMQTYQQSRPSLCVNASG